MDLKFAAVRAMAPVAGTPPKNMLKMLATPSPISSALELWLSPLMPSTTVALSKDSTPARKAIVKPLGKTFKSKATERSGICGAGRK